MSTGPHQNSTATRFFLSACLLTLLGLFFVFSVSQVHALNLTGNQYFFVQQQLQWVVVGMAGLLLLWRVHPDVWERSALLLYTSSLSLLVFTFLPGLGMEINGARRWIGIGSFSFQPVELVKFALVMYLAVWLRKRQSLVPFLGIVGLPVGLIMLQPDMGSALIVLAIAFGLYFLAGVPWQTFGKLLVLGVLALGVLVLVSPYRLRRIQSYFDPGSDPLGASFHIRQITIALGNGGWLGQGIGRSHQKYAYIPEASTDSIFAIIAEEVGFVGSVIILLCFCSFFLFGERIVHHQKTESFAFYAAGGLLIWLAAQFLLNLAAIVALVPLTGVPLPFFSYGGTALAMTLGVVGVLLGFERRATKKE